MKDPVSLVLLSVLAAATAAQGQTSLGPSPAQRPGRADGPISDRQDSGYRLQYAILHALLDWQGDEYGNYKEEDSRILERFGLRVAPIPPDALDEYGRLVRPQLMRALEAIRRGTSRVDMGLEHRKLIEKYGYGPGLVKDRKGHELQARRTAGEIAQAAQGRGGHLGGVLGWVYGGERKSASGGFVPAVRAGSVRMGAAAHIREAQSAPRAEGRIKSLSPAPPQPRIPVLARSPANSKLVYDRNRELIGAPYVSGGSSRKGTDCSGSECHAFRGLGVQLPHRASIQARDAMAGVKALFMYAVKSKDGRWHVRDSPGGAWRAASERQVLARISQGDQMYFAGKKGDGMIRGGSGRQIQLTFQTHVGTAAGPAQAGSERTGPVVPILDASKRNNRFGPRSATPDRGWWARVDGVACVTGRAAEGSEKGLRVKGPDGVTYTAADKGRGHSRRRRGHG